MSRIPTTPQGDDYIKRHGLDGLFNDLMNRLLQDRPMEPISYLIKTLTDITEKCKNPMPVVQDVFSMQEGTSGSTKEYDTGSGISSRSASHQSVAMPANYSFTNDVGTKRMRTETESPSLKATTSKRISYYTKLAQAWNIQLDWAQLRIPKLMNFIQIYSNMFGCPDEYFLIPLLSIVASLMGNNAECKVTQVWKEPCVLWMAVAARKGEESSLIYRKFLEELKITEHKIQPHPQQKLLDFHRFDTRKLYSPINSLSHVYHHLSTNHNQLLAVSEELGFLYDFLAAKNPQEKKMFTSLFHGDNSCVVAMENQETPESKTSLNLMGFMEPQVLVKQLSVNSIDDLSASLLISCPPERDILLEDLNHATPDLSFHEVFWLIHKVHSKEHIMYEFNEDSMTIARSYLNSLTIRKREVNFDENRRLILCKARSQFVRLCMVLQCVNNAVGAAYNMKHVLQLTSLCDTDDQSWHSSTISSDVATAAAYLSECFLLQKLALMPEEMKLNINLQQVTDNTPQPRVPTLKQDVTDENDVSLSYCRSRSNYASLDPDELEEYYESQYPKFPENCENNIRSFLAFDGEFVHSSKVMQVHLMPPFHTPGPGKNRYAAPAAKFFMRKMANLGVGKLFRKGNKGGLIFMKTKWEDLDENARGLVERCGVSELEYKVGKRSRVSNAGNGDLMAASLTVVVDDDSLPPVNLLEQHNEGVSMADNQEYRLVQ
ncbi:uncharacterized protein LOC102801783 [Saccoglossus kowalevskii]|uniref:Uncharacterized protein LOC102801783 n=1 Tax=Saccoglossus kowalevskii TaxID=10224 RepID=A0ABM0M8T8_SACKO|nr:PREDICTED: uncharacterized protein LOC102801783 [Saccoglossus kowalevskii]